MGWNVICKQGHNVSTELESLMYVLIFILTGGILPWRRVAFEDHSMPSIRYGAMASSEFSRRILSYVCVECHSMIRRLRDLFFPPGYSTDVTPDMFIAEVHLQRQGCCSECGQVIGVNSNYVHSM